MAFDRQQRELSRCDNDLLVFAFLIRTLKSGRSLGLARSFYPARNSPL